MPIVGLAKGATPRHGRELRKWRSSLDCQQWLRLCRFFGFDLGDAWLQILRALFTDFRYGMKIAGQVCKYQKRCLNLSCLKDSLVGE